MTRLLVCDLDNTLYDWVGYFVPAFYSMVDEAVRITGCERERLLDDFREVHQLHHDSEHPFALLETHTINEMFPGQTRAELARLLDPAFHAFNKARIEHLTLYDGVEEGLVRLKQQGVRLVAHTEAKLFSVVFRLEKLKLTGLFENIYCRERSDTPHVSSSVQSRWLRSFPMQKVRELTVHQRKPNACVLREICAAEGVSSQHAAYVGDSIARDIMMAKQAEVFAVWAKYGARHTSAEYDALVRISHWTQEDVEREKALAKQAEGIEPDAVLEKSFAELVEILPARSKI